MSFVRVVIPESGAHVTVSEAWAESAGLKPVKGDSALSEGGTVLPATDKDGKPLQVGVPGADLAETVVVAPATESEAVK
jgi:hypothetical protein